MVASASPPRKSKARKEKILWTADRTRSFLEWCQTERNRLWPAFAFVATSGDRRGANLGLHWSDIDFDDGIAQLITTVTAVRHQIVVKPYGKTGAHHLLRCYSSALHLTRPGPSPMAWGFSSSSLHMSIQGLGSEWLFGQRRPMPSSR